MEFKYTAPNHSQSLLAQEKTTTPTAGIALLWQSKLWQSETESVSPTQSLRGTKFRGNLLHDAICLIIITSISQEIATSAAPPRNDYLKGEVVRVALRFTRVCFAVGSQ